MHGFRFFGEQAVAVIAPAAGADELGDAVLARAAVSAIEFVGRGVADVFETFVAADGELAAKTRAITEGAQLALADPESFAEFFALHPAMIL